MSALELRRFRSSRVIVLLAMLITSGCSAVLTKRPQVAQEIATDPQCRTWAWKIPFALDYSVASLSAGSAIYYLLREGEFVTTRRRLSVLAAGIGVASMFIYSAEVGRVRGRRCERETARWNEVRAKGTQRFIRERFEAEASSEERCRRLKAHIDQERDFRKRTELLNGWLATCKARPSTSTPKRSDTK